jgi:peptidoglycan/LPS O-acetylase OafA/YrhL
MKLKVPRGIVWVVLCYVLALVLFTTLEVTGIVAPRVFAIFCLVAMVVAGIVSYRVFKSTASLPSLTDERPRLSERKRWFVLAAVVAEAVPGYNRIRNETGSVN